MIEVAMRDENRVDAWTNMLKGSRNNCRVRPNRPLQRYSGKPDACEVRINEKRTTVGFELVTVDAEICHSD